MDLLNFDERQKFLDEAQKERKQRELSRKNNEFITQINAVIRGHLARKAFRSKLKSDFLERFCQNASKTKSNTELLKSGSFIFNNLIKKTDDAQVVDGGVAKALVESIQSPVKNVSFAALFLSVQHIQLATKFITDVFRFLPPKLAKQNFETNFSVKAATISIVFLELYGSCANWPLVAGNNAILPILEGLCAKFYSPLCESTCFEQLTLTLSNGLKGSKMALPSNVINQLFLVIYRAMKKMPADEMSKKFVRHVLTAPALILTLNNSSLNLLKADGFFSSIITTLNKDQLNGMSGMSLVNLMANLIHLSYLEQQLLIENLYDWTVSLNALLLKCQQTSTSGTSNRQNRYHHPILGWIKDRIDEGTQGTFDRVRTQIEFLWSRKMINCLFGQVLASFELPLASKSNTKQTKLSGTEESGGLPTEIMQKFLKKLSLREAEFTMKDVPNVSVTAIVCQLYQNVLLLFANPQIDVVSALCQDDRLLTQLWAFLNDPSTGGVNNYLKLLSADPSASLAHFSPLHLFCGTACSLISILDEVEMYEQDSPFTLSQLTEIARFTNIFCFQCIWRNLIDFEQHRPNALFQSVYQFCSTLHNRDCRRAFTPHNFWIAPDVKPSAIVSEFEGQEPRAQILMTKMPHLIPLRDRMVLFRKLINREKDLIMSTPTNYFTIDRTRIVEDGYRQLAAIPPSALRSTIRVKFINQLGLEEIGIDQDGVFKEFLELTLKKVFDPELNLFKSTSNNLLYPSSNSHFHENHLALFQFVGRMLGKAVFEGICIDVNLAPVLLATVLNKQLCPFDELSLLDPELYKHLVFVKHYKENIRDLELTFAYTEEALGKITTLELVPGGNDVYVNDDNKIQYVHRMAHFRVVSQTKNQCNNFVSGFRSIINPKWLALFSTHELQFVISGQTSDIDLQDLKKHTQYYGGFHSNHRVIRWLWSILEKDFTAEERHMFLKFATSCSRPPLLGFAYLEPAFSIRCVESSDEMDQGDTLTSVIRGFLTIKTRKQPTTRLPSSSTCFNLLKLPNYQKRSILLEKLRYAIRGDAGGFELS
ncbi:HECT-type E3 ubiquitin transferase [Aphelenchoides bicaudatus]|nr:HECT-type E3 ubiquitin transferase [Aphelenchoides bicaudatus]